MMRGEMLQQQILESVAALAAAVRCGDWQAAEASDRAMREHVLTLASAVDVGQADANAVRATLATAHEHHLRALEEARGMALQLRKRLSRIGVGRRASDAYRSAHLDG